MTPRRLLLASLGAPLVACAVPPPPPAAAPHAAPAVDSAPDAPPTTTSPATLFSTADLTRAATKTEPTNDAPSDHLSDVAMSLDVRIPMRDGVTLSATIFRPAGVTAKLPVIVDVTPYVSDTDHAWAVYYAKRGYVAASVDIRGRGDSGGEFDPWHPHPNDMTDTIEWLARRPWSNGEVAMMGGSYLGLTQWWTAREAPPHLTTIVPLAPVSIGVDFPFDHGIATSYAVPWLSFVGGRALRTRLFGDDDLWGRFYAGFVESKRPFRELDAAYAGAPSRAFQAMLQHPTYDAFWQSARPTPAQYAAMKQSVLTVTGDFDGDQHGALTYYRDHMRYGAPAVTAEHYLVIGPWDHAGTRRPKRDMGGLHFGEASLVDIQQLGERWYDWRMKDGNKPDFLKDRVAYYVSGAHAEKWKYAPTLDAATKDRRRLFLGSDGGGAGDLFHSGSLLPSVPAADHATPDHYVDDPNDLDVVYGARPRPSHDDDWLTAQDGLSDLHGAALVYHSAPLPEELELAGSLKLSVWLAMDVPDADVRAAAYEITAEGKSIQLGYAFMRARYRESPSRPTLVPAGVPVRYDFDDFWWFARRLAKGSRIRLVIGAPNFTGIDKLTDFEINHHTGGVIADESAKDARVAHVTLLHDDAHPSVLELPIGQ